MHRTYRWLDAPPRLFGLSFRQWLLLVLAIGAGYGLVRALHVPGKVAVSAGLFVIGLPATLAYLSEGDSLPFGRVLVDAIAWVATRRLFGPGASLPSHRLPVVRVREHDGEDTHREAVLPAEGLLEQLVGDGRWDA